MFLESVKDRILGNQAQAGYAVNFIFNANDHLGGLMKGRDDSESGRFPQVLSILRRHWLHG